MTTVGTVYHLNANVYILADADEIYLFAGHPRVCNAIQTRDHASAQHLLVPLFLRQLPLCTYAVSLLRMSGGIRLCAQHRAERHGYPHLLLHGPALSCHDRDSEWPLVAFWKGLDVLQHRGMEICQDRESLCEQRTD